MKVFLQKTIYSLALVLFFSFSFGQIPAGYYDAAVGKTGDVLRSALGTIISPGGYTTVTKLSYTPGVWNAYAYTDVTTMGGTTIFDMYSRRCDGTANYYYTLATNQCGTASVEGDCYSREHCLPNSCWGGLDNAANPQYSDLHHLFPCDQAVNVQKSNNMLGETSAPTYTSSNGSMTGPCSYPGYTDKVFEPLDCYKGDFARAWLYLATRYMTTMPSWAPSSGSAAMWPLIYNSTTNNYQPWVINMFLSWCTLDPVDQWEIDRNNAIYYNSGQHNRNPYVDHPEYVCLVWGTSCASAPNITNIVTSPATPTSSDPVNISASITDDGSVSSAILYWGTSPTSITNTKTMAVGTVPTYTTTSAIPAQVAGTTVYYKIVVTDNQSNSTTSEVKSYNIPQGEPSGQATNFSCGTTTSMSIPLTWIDATGAIIPNAYLIKMSAISFADITDPVDGTPIADGSNAKNVLAGIQTTTFTGLSSNTAYYFKIYAYSNSGSNTNYNITGAPSTSCSTLAESGCASTVFFDDFNRASVSPGGTPAMTYTSTMVGTSTATIVSNSYLKIANGTTSGVSYVSGSTSTFGSPYNTTLVNNSGLITWTFNFKYDRTSNPSGLASGNYGTAIILAGSSSTVTIGTGYAIAYGQSGTADSIRLVKYTSGISTSTDIIKPNVRVLSDFKNYVSVKVTYDPNSNNWSLYLRDDGTSSWSDPSTGSYTQAGTTTYDNTYTGTPLNTFGFVWAHATTAATANADRFDNFKVTMNTSPPTAYDMTGGGSYCSGGSGVAVGLSNSETGVNYQLEVDDVNTGSPAGGTGAVIDFGNQTVEGTYTVLATRAGSGCTTVMNGSASVIITPSPAASVSISANTGTSVCPSTSVTYTAIVTNGGTSPTYQWNKNGASVGGATNSIYTDTPVNNDYYTCVIISNLACVIGSPATSNTLTMSVAGLTASVNITANPAGAVCAGTSVTFTATPTNGGTPVYQWKKGGSNITGETNSTYTTTTLANADAITCQMTSSLACAVPSQVTSNTITMTVNPILPVSVSIAASTGTTICAGTSVTFTATPTNGGVGPTYQWKKGGVNISGETNATYVTSTLANSDAITCVLTSNATCPTGNPATSNTLNMTVNPILTAGISIAALPSGAICAGTSVTFTATPTNGGAGPTYQWKKGGVDISGATNSTFTSTTLANGDAITCLMTSNASPCLTGSPATSNTIAMLVGTPGTVSVSIAAAPGATICTGASVTFTATHTNGGIPTYQWKKNNIDVGSNSSTYTDAGLNNNDQIICIVTGSLSCATGSPATSNTITMAVNPNLPVSVSIGASTATTICAGTSVTFTATPTNGGAGPTYQWKKGGVNISGETNATYVTSTLANGDAITCVLTSNATCTSGNPATSNTITMTVNPLPAASGIISGIGTVCQTQYNEAYFVDPIANATSYTWSYSGTGATISGSTNSITIDFNASATSGILTVKGTNACGDGTASANFPITVNQHAAAAGTISGTAAVCQGQSGIAYSVGTIANATYYTWEYSGTGATINGTTDNITINFAANATGGNLTVKGLNTCGYGTISAAYPMTVNPLPTAAGTISGTAAVCQGQSGVVYSVGAIANATGYTWEYTGTGATINESANSITIDFASNATGGILTVYGTNACGSGTISANYAITVPQINISTTALAGFYYTGAGPSAEQTFTVSGSDLPNSITIAASTNYEISLTSGSGYTTPLTLTQTGGSVATTTIYVRLKAGLSAGSYNGENISASSTCATSQNVSCNGSASTATATISISPGALSGFSYMQGSGPSAQQSFTVSGIYLNGNISIAPSTNYEISTGSGGSFAATNPVTLTQSGGTVSSTTIYVRLKAGLTAANYNSESITASSTGATSQAVICNGSVISAAPLAAWDFTSCSTCAISVATTFNAGLGSSSNITRGPTATASAGTTSFRTAGFKNEGISTSNTDYFQTTIGAAAGYQVSLSTIDAKFNGTQTFVGTGGVTAQFAYSLDGSNYTLIGSPFVLTGTVPLTMTQISLTSISALQNVPAGTTITLRYYASGQTTTGGWGFYSASAGTNGLAIGGSVLCTTPSTPSVSVVDNCGNSTLTASNYTGTLLWNTSETSNPISASTAGTYSVKQTVNGCASASGSAVAAPQTMPTITGTTDGSLCGTGSVTLGAIASAGIINWYSAPTGGSSLAIGTSYTTPSLITPTTYYVDATYNGCTTSSRTAVTANVGNPPAITGQPSNASTCAGTGTTAFTVTATGIGLTYQWEDYYSSAWHTITNGAVYSGATLATLTLTNPPIGMNDYKYRCIVSGTCSPAATSDGNATLTLNSFPGAASTISGTSIVSQGQNGVGYSVGAVSNATSYTWAYTGTGASFSGSTNSITINFSGAATSGLLTVRGTNACGNGIVSASYPITIGPTGAFYLTSAGSGSAHLVASWKNSSNSSPSNFTTDGDVFIIPGGINGTFGVSTTFGNSGGADAAVTLRVDGTAIINSGFTVTVTSKGTGSNVIVNGTIIFSGTSAVQLSLVSGANNNPVNFALNSGATLKTANTYGINGTNCSISAIGNTPGTPTFSTVANYEFNGASQAMAGIPATVNNLTFSGSGAKTFLNTVTTVNGNLTMSGTATTTTTANLAIGGSLVIGSGTTFTTGSNFTLGVSGTSSVTGTLTLAGTGAKTFTGNVTVYSSGIWNETGVASINFGGNLQNDATTFTASTGTHTFTGTGKTISGATAVTIPNLTISGTTTNNGTLTVGIALAGAGGLTNGAAGILNIGGTSSITTLANAGTATITGAGAISTVLANFTNTGTLNLNGTGTIVGITNNTGGIINLASSGTITSINNATSTSALNISATPVPTITTLTATAIGNTVNYAGAAQTVKAPTYSNLTLSGSGSKTISGVTVNGILSMEGTATASAAPGYGASSTIQYKGSGAQTTGVELPATFNGSGGLVIANTSGSAVALAAAIAEVLSGPLTINSSGKFEISPTSSLTIGGATANAGTFTIKSDATGTGSFIDNGTITGAGTFKVQKYLTNGRWWYLGSPITAATAGTSFGITTLPPVNTGNRLFYWDATTNNVWVRNNPADAIEVLRGYSFKDYDAVPFTAVFTGTLNTGTIGGTANLAYHTPGASPGFNLVCNPYPSAINWGCGSTPTSGLTQTNIGTTIWYRTDPFLTGGSFATYNWSGVGVGANGGERFVPAMQAFWVRANVGGGGLQLTNAARDHSTQAFYKTAETNVFRLEVADSASTDETVIGFYQNAQNIFEDYDSEKMFATDDIPQVYSLTSDNTQVAINGQPELLPAEERIISLGFKTPVASNFSMTATNLSDFDQNVSVYLEDVQQNVIRDLRQAPVYNFSSGIVDNANRFRLHFGNIVTGISTVTEDQATTYSFANSVYVNIPNSNSGLVELYDILGNLIYKQNIAKGLNKLSVVLTQGIYISVVKIDKKDFTQKIIILKQ